MPTRDREDDADKPVGCWRGFARTAIAVFQFLFGAMLCKQWLGAVLVVGWCYRLMQRHMLRTCWAVAKPEGSTWEQFVTEATWTSVHDKHPNWLRRPRCPDAERPNGPLGWPLGSLWHNLGRGFRALFVTWAITLPPCLLWLLGWDFGWVNSFTSGYEQNDLGALTVLLGTLLFALVMIYLPLAQARHALTEDWQTAFQPSIIRVVRRHAPFGYLALTIGYTLTTPLLMVAISAPMFFPQIFNVAAESWTNAEALQLLRRYFSGVCLMAFPICVGLKLLAAHVYAKGLINACRAGAVDSHTLSEREQWLFDRLELGKGPTSSPSGCLKVAVGKLTVALSIILWLSFAAPLVITAFFNYHGPRIWLNQPMIQMPWFQYLPNHLLESESKHSPEPTAPLVEGEPAEEIQN